MVSSTCREMQQNAVGYRMVYFFYILLFIQWMVLLNRCIEIFSKSCKALSISHGIISQCVIIIMDNNGFVAKSFILYKKGELLIVTFCKPVSQQVWLFGWKTCTGYILIYDSLLNCFRIDFNLPNPYSGNSFTVKFSHPTLHKVPLKEVFKISYSSVCNLC